MGGSTIGMGGIGGAGSGGNVHSGGQYLSPGAAIATFPTFPQAAANPNTKTKSTSLRNVWSILSPI
jgi:hypothetical protein